MEREGNSAEEQPQDLIRELMARGRTTWFRSLSASWLTSIHHVSHGRAGRRGEKRTDGSDEARDASMGDLPQRLKESGYDFDMAVSRADQDKSPKVRIRLPQ
jgi:hypothetical protein